jgi:hypothetical protein
VFSKIDLHSGYHQIKIRAKDIPKLAITTRYGLFEYLVMSFGFDECAGTLHVPHELCLHAGQDKFIMVFINDILVYSKCMEEHGERL